MRVLDGVDSGSNYQFGDKLAKPAFPRSAFDLSHLNTMTVPNAGMVFPVLCKEVLPSDSWQVRINALLRVLPQVVPLYSRQRMYFDAFYVRCSDVWKDWNVYMKKGNDGNTLLTRPALTMKNISSDGLSLTGIGGADPDPDDSRTWSKAVVQANSIYDYMGIPIGTDLVDLIGKGYHIDALPFAALLQIYRWYYLNKNRSRSKAVQMQVQGRGRTTLCKRKGRGKVVLSPKTPHARAKNVGRNFRIQK